MNIFPYLAIVIIYIISQLLDKWGKMPEEFKAYNLFTKGLVGWSAGIVGFVSFLDKNIQFNVCLIFSIVFWVGTIVYLYRKKIKKLEPKKIMLESSIEPLAPVTVKMDKIKKPKHPKLIFLLNFVFILFGVAESIYFIGSAIILWDVVTIPVGNVNVAVLTYRNGVLLLFFALGVFLAGVMTNRLRHPRKAFFEDD